ncbi:tyrosine-protein kinase receptor torso-like [Anticarsia gemmatalis]|uniref:tyrosine-protein kinase receptor torso-like n=1 Tax=Anticarsia gemmatalis TaxID=129554 RepID=UPI003F758292
MLYKKYGHYIILCLIKQITLDYVSGKPMDIEKTKTLIPDDLMIEQLEMVAGDVCFHMALNKLTDADEDKCKYDFLDTEFALSPHLSPVKIRCTTESTIRFQIVPSQNLQLVILVPEFSNDSDVFSVINYSLIEPLMEYGDVSTTPISNYTLWSTELVNGTPRTWQGGDLVPLYNESALPKHQEYEVKVDFRKELVNSTTLMAGVLTWSPRDENDVCFDVSNLCDNSEDGNRDITKIWPNQKPELDINKLPLNTTCNFSVKGLYGTTYFKYTTPTCEKIYCTSMKPAYPEIINIEAFEESSDTWEVHVGWKKPIIAVERYNITLRSNEIWSQVVAGDIMETVFNGITGEGLYNVSVYAIKGDTHAHTSGRAYFPGRAGSGARGAALGAGAAAAALAIVCCWRARRRPKPPPHYPLEDKPSKEGDMEAESMTLETEDSWEVRSDKLLLHEVIGEGAFGVVRRATLAPNSINVAVKMLKDFPSQEEIRSFRSEMELMKSVGVHPHLVSLVGCCSGRRPLIIAEYCSRGDLLTYLRCTWDVMVSKRNAKYYNNNIDVSDYRNDLFKCKTQMENSKLVVNKLYELQEICDRELTSLDLLSFCRQIAMGMEFLAANRVVHRDLAARNILVTGDRTLKIADFGLSRDVYEENQYKQKGNGKMPVKWMALESLTRRIYTTQSDVWSFGVVVWEIATIGAAPYASVPAARLPRLLRAGYRMPKPANCIPQLYDIMLSCWRSHPRERPTFAELHARLDELLNSASAHHYLSLEIEPLDAPPTPKHHRYIKMLIRGKRNWSRGESYERPLKPPQSNHYTSPPVVLTKNPPV